MKTLRRTLSISAAAGLFAVAGLGLGMAHAADGDPVPVPPNYVYNPDLGSLHDYCTASPDEFPSPVGANADFRGPCANHDLCLEGGSTPNSDCNAALRNQMRQQCEHYYGTFDPTRIACLRTADVYWAAVTAKNP